MKKKKFSCLELKRQIQQKLSYKTKGNIEKLALIGEKIANNSLLWQHFQKKI